MSEVKLLYDSEDIFSNVGPTPFISRDVQNIYSNSEINLVDTLSLTGRIKRNYPASVSSSIGLSGASGPTGASGSTYSLCESGFQGIKNVADSLVSKFSKNFKKLQLTEKIGDGQTKIIEEWENCIVKSISFDDNKWYDWVPYTIDIECFKKGYFENYGIIDPKRSLQLDVAPDNTINITLTCSCKGLNKIDGGFQNAKNFVASNSNLLSSDLRNFYLSYPSYAYANNLFTFESEFDNATYWLRVNTAIQADDAIAPDGTQTADSLVCSSNALNTIRGQSTNSFVTGVKKYKASIYVKSGTGEWVTLTVGSNYTAKTWFNISTGQKGSKEVQNSKVINIIYYDIESFDNGWYKISMIFESFGDYSLFFTLSQVDSNGTSTYASRSGKSISIWKASIEDFLEIYDLNSYNIFLVSQDESLNRLTGEVSLNKTFILQSSSYKSNYGILKYTRDMSVSETGETSVKIDGNHQGPLLARGLTGINSTDSTLEAIQYDISPKDWYSIANDIYIKNLTEYSYPNFSSRISQRVAGKTGTIDEIRIWSTFNTSTQSFAKNPSCWIFGIDISGLIVGCNEPGYESKKVGMMISPKHYLCLWHFKVPIGTTLYFLTNDNKVLTRTVSNFIEVTGLESITSDIALCLLNEELPNTVKFLKILSKDYNIFGNSLVGSYIFIRDQRDTIDDPNNYQKANIKKIVSIPGPEPGTITYGDPPSNPELYFINVEAGANHDSSNNVCLITPNDEMIALGLNVSGSKFIHLSPFIDNINKAMAELGGEYSVTEYYPEDFSPLYRTPTNFSLQRDFSNNSVNFSLEFSNKQDNKVYVVDETEITHDLISSRKCIQANLTIRSEIKCKKERWDNVLKYYNQLDFVDYVQKKWTKFGNTERLNFNEKDNSYSENQFEGTIQIDARFCNSLGFDCGCLQNFTYEYSFVPAISEVKASLPINSNGCHFIENMNTVKRAAFNIKGSLIKPVCCSYEKTVAQLRNRINQIANSLFYGKNKILDSSQISKVSPAGSISFDFSWSAEKAIIIPENLL
jgi:hypothetical protein